MALPALWQPSLDYKISTEVYEGPLDLLLQLIERSELDITKLSLAKVTDQYLNHIREISHQDPVDVSAFLVIAAKLVLIKSMILLPTYTDSSEETDSDPGDQLANQLIAYKQIKSQAEWLGSRMADGLRSYYRLSPPPKVNEKLDLSGIHIKDLVNILIDLYFQHDDRTPISDVVSISTLTLKKRINEIIQRFKDEPVHNFFTLLGEAYTKLDIVVTFLAVLELIKHHSIIATQPILFTDIVFEKTGTLDVEIETEF
jgi:segregation and condensation protein A